MCLTMSTGWAVAYLACWCIGLSFNVVLRDQTSTSQTISCSYMLSTIHFLGLGPNVAVRFLP